MAEREIARIRIGADSVVAVAGHSERRWLQSADIVIGDCWTVRSARRWLVTTLDRYPGCTIAVARHRRRRWLLVGSRDGLPFLVRAPSIGLG